MAEEGLYDGQVLLTEDNIVNQEVARAFLQKLGCRVELAGNGREALEAFSRNDFDLVFMDCQMPVMDGYETARVIRAREVSAGASSHLPIIAMTAHALEGDREKCLEAGMDDYLGKPFTVGQLRAILDKWLPRAPLEGKSSGGSTNEAAPAPAAAPQATGGSSHPAMAAIDRKILDNIRALQQSGAQGLLERVIQAYLQETPKLLDRLYAALKQGDADAARNAAHSLKSSSAHVGAVKLASLLKELEAMAKAAALNDSARMITAVSQEFGLVQQALHAELREEAA